MSTLRGFRALALGCALSALVVIVLGAYVRLSDAGLGCPDWPGCYGRLLAPTAEHDVAAATQAYPERPVEVGKAWKEMVHRYVAALLGLGILVMTLIAWRLPAETGLRKASTLLLALVVFQGMLGMLTVTWLLKPLVVVAHLLGGISVLALLWWLLLRAGGLPLATAPGAGRLPALWPAAGLAVALAQIALGGWTSTNYAALACTDFPTCHGRWWPDMDWRTGFTLWHGLGVDYEFGILDSPARTAIHVGHRIGALIASVVLVAVAVRALREPTAVAKGLGALLLTLLAAQVSMGIANVKLGLPLYNAVAHTAGAALLVLTLVTLVHFARPQGSRVAGR